jgi:hypothetical protein
MISLQLSAGRQKNQFQLSNWQLCLVIHSFHKPLSTQLVLHQAIQRESGFGARRCPTPRATSLPVPTSRRKSARDRRSRRFHRRCLRARAAHAHRLRFAQSNARSQRRTKQAQGNHRAHFFLRAFFLPFVHPQPDDLRCHFLAWTYPAFDFLPVCMLNFTRIAWAFAPRAHRRESAAPQMRLRDAYPVIPPTPLSLADNARNARQGQLQLFRLGKNRLKQSTLQGSRARRFGRQMNLHDGRSRRMRLQIKLQQFQKHFRVQHGRGQPQANKRASKRARDWLGKCARCVGVHSRCAIVRRSVRLRVPVQSQLLHRQRALPQSRAYLLQHAVQQKCQRLQQHDGIFQFHTFGKNQLRFQHAQIARRRAPRQLLQTDPRCPRRSLSGTSGRAASDRNLRMPQRSNISPSARPLSASEEKLSSNTSTGRSPECSASRLRKSRSRRKNRGPRAKQHPDSRPRQGSLPVPSERLVAPNRGQSLAADRAAARARQGSAARCRAMCLPLPERTIAHNRAMRSVGRSLL